MEGDLVPSGGNSGAAADALLEEGVRLEKAGLFEKALSCYRDVRSHTTDPARLAVSWRLEAHAHHGLGAWDAALDAARRSETLSRELGRGDLVAEALNAAAAVHHARGQFGDAKALYREMLTMAESPRVQGLALQNIAIIHGQGGELEEAERRLRAALGRFEEAGYDRGRAHVLNNLVAVANRRGDFAAAEEEARRATRVARQADDLDLLAIATLNLAESLAGLGRLEEAEEEASIALGQFQVSGNRWRRIACLTLLGDLNARQGAAPLAHKFWTSGLQLAREVGAAADVVELERRLAQSDSEEA